MRGNAVDLKHTIAVPGLQDRQGCVDNEGNLLLWIKEINMWLPFTLNFLVSSVEAMANAGGNVMEIKILHLRYPQVITYPIHEAQMMKIINYATFNRDSLYPLVAALANGTQLRSTL